MSGSYFTIVVNLVCIATVQLNSNLTLTRISLAESRLILSLLASWLQVHERVSDNLWQTTLVRHAKLLEQSLTV